MGRRSLAGVWQRQPRWARLRRLSFPGLFCAELPAGGVFPFLLAGWFATEGVLPWAGVVAMMLAWYGAGALLACAFGWPLRVRSPLFWIARDLLLPVLWGPCLIAQGLRTAWQHRRRPPHDTSPGRPIQHAPSPLAAALRLAAADMKRPRAARFTARQIRAQRAPTTPAAATVRTQPVRLRDVLTSTLRREVETELAEHGDARGLADDALRDHGEHAAADALPNTCPYSRDQIISDWLPK